MKTVFMARLFCAVLLIWLVACSPQDSDETLPTLAVLPTLFPTTEPPTAAPATDIPTAEPAEPTPEPEAPPVAGDMGGAMLPGCDNWLAWDVSRQQLRENIYAQVLTDDPAQLPLMQVQRLREEVAALDYDECLSEARTQYLAALDAAAQALAAPDRASAAVHEQAAVVAVAAFEAQITGLAAGS